MPVIFDRETRDKLQLVITCEQSERHEGRIPKCRRLNVFEDERGEAIAEGELMRALQLLLRYICPLAIAGVLAGAAQGLAVR